MMLDLITNLMDWLFSPTTFWHSLVRNYNDIIAIAEEFPLTVWQRSVTVELPFFG